jgi:SPP1 family predicted phage head-tail adaptor
MLSRLKQRASLLSKTLVSDGGGGFSESWQTLADVWIEITPLGAKEKFSADALQARVRHRIVLRARDDIVPGLRLATPDRVFAVRAVLARDKGAPLLTLLCEELP